MQIEHLILAKGSSIDVERNTVSLFDIFEEISVTAPSDSVLFVFHLFVVVRRTDEVGEIEVPFRIQVFSPDGQEVSQGEMLVKMAAQHRRFRFRGEVPVPIHKSGDVRFVISERAHAGNRREFYLTVTLKRVEAVSSLAN